MSMQIMFYVLDMCFFRRPGKIAWRHNQTMAAGRSVSLNWTSLQLICPVSALPWPDSRSERTVHTLAQNTVPPYPIFPNKMCSCFRLQEDFLKSELIRQSSSHGTAVQRIVLYCTITYNSVLYHSILHGAVLHYDVLHCTAMHYSSIILKNAPIF